MTTILKIAFAMDSYLYCGKNKTKIELKCLHVYLSVLYSKIGIFKLIFHLFTNLERFSMLGAA